MVSDCVDYQWCVSIMFYSMPKRPTASTGEGVHRIDLIVQAQCFVFLVFS